MSKSMTRRFKIPGIRPLIGFALLFLFLGCSNATAKIKVDRLPNPDLFLDAEWYKGTVLQTTDLWNGGPEGKTGMGSYQKEFTGLYDVNLDQAWNSMGIRSMTVIAEARAIYMNIEAYRVAGEKDGKKFLDAFKKGADYFLDHFLDKEKGGFYFELGPNGEVYSDSKQGYGNVYCLFVLSHLYSVTKDEIYKTEAENQLAILEKYFLDPEYAGGIRPGFSRDFSKIEGVNNIDTFTHYFEALLALNDISDGEKKDHVASLITTAGNFLCQKLAVIQTGVPDNAYVAYNYDTKWDPAQKPYSRQTQWTGALHASTGHGVELAYLLSRAVERGYDQKWLSTGEKLINFCRTYALDDITKAMIYECTDYQGQPLTGNPDNAVYVWWAQFETARALLHWSVVRGKNYVQDFKTIEYFINNFLFDFQNRGEYREIKRDTLLPTTKSKGDVWKVNYHLTMYFVETIRLLQTYPDQVNTLAQTLDKKQLDTAIHKMNQITNPSASDGAVVGLKEMTAFPYLAMEMKGSENDVYKYVEMLFAQAAAKGVTASGSLFMLYLNKPEDNKDPSDMVWEIGLPVSKEFKPDAPMLVKTWNYPKVASKVFDGPLDELQNVYAEIHDWIKAENLTAITLGCEIYKSVPTEGSSGKMEAQVEIQVPVK